VKRLAALIVSVALGGCASLGEPVQAWQKGTLAKRGMALEPDRLKGKLTRQLYASKEGANGASGVGGGGCGCN
jgi:hypothetical protein